MMWSEQEYDLFCQSAMETALWSGQDWTGEGDNPEPLDTQYSLDDIAATTWGELFQDCQGFLDGLSEACAVEVRANLERAGHDFHLTRNRHGAGFWDGEWQEGDVLTEWAHTFGTFELCPNGDGSLIHHN